MLSTGEVYREAGGDDFTRLEPAKHLKHLIARLERLGHTVTLRETTA
jgi:hypothetical protein